jgi:D-xylose reductase
MEKAVEQGLIKHIGISNYTGALILDCLAYAKIHPSVLQIEHHPYLTQPKLYLFKSPSTKYSQYIPFSKFLRVPG